ncbi:hypothetical protein A2311_06845 [candidate division WOR-1 bacterium RIFOXYB2_FULL_48_7]|uniref:Uncharacterized protein n=1 Tax=candidate division WOR-1 bacterium RIFOXYB2_FULL_48_7 TaxID=1802583 RepID=A0A1F4TVL0_UNCSA|nr:MAG: hypothetical protein A2311_06845 [candidate division WOR-1 bacterium RIFOXYB2_FULL_48_7]
MLERLSLNRRGFLAATTAGALSRWASDSSHHRPLEHPGPRMGALIDQYNGRLQTVENDLATIKLWLTIHDANNPSCARLGEAEIASLDDAERPLIYAPEYCDISTPESPSHFYAVASHDSDEIYSNQTRNPFFPGFWAENGGSPFLTDQALAYLRLHNIPMLFFDSVTPQAMLDAYSALPNDRLKDVIDWFTVNAAFYGAPIAWGAIASQQAKNRRAFMGLSLLAAMESFLFRPDLEVMRRIYAARGRETDAISFAADLRNEYIIHFRNLLYAYKLLVYASWLNDNFGVRPIFLATFGTRHFELQSELTRSPAELRGQIEASLRLLNLSWQDFSEEVKYGYEMYPHRQLGGKVVRVLQFNP